MCADRAAAEAGGYRDTSPRRQTEQAVGQDYHLDVSPWTQSRQSRGLGSLHPEVVSLQVTGPLRGRTGPVPRRRRPGGDAHGE